MRFVKNQRALTITSQILSSVTNVTLTVFLAASSSASEFGAFAIVLIAYHLTVGVGSAAIGQAEFLRVASNPGSPSPAALAALPFGAILAPPLILGSLFLGQATAPSIVLAVCLPFLALHDVLRYVFFASNQAGLAVGIDAVWLASVSVAVATRQADSAFGVLVSWAVSGTLVAFIGIYFGRHQLCWDLSKRFRLRRDLARFAGDNLLGTGAGMAATVSVGALGPIAGAGGLRGAQTIMGPAGVILSGLTVTAGKEAAISLTSHAANYRRRLVTTTALASALMFGATGAAILVPDAVGLRLLGETWNGAQPLILWVGLGLTGRAVSLGAQVHLRTSGSTSTLIRARTIDGVLTIGAGFFGALWGGAVGAAIGVACAKWSAAVYWWDSTDFRSREPDS